MYILGVITARGGSKRLPGKNVKVLAGKPLIGYVIEAAHSSAVLNQTILSTDSEIISCVASAFSIEIPFMRPEELSQDTASSEDVLRHAVEFIELKGQKVDVVVLLQPTSPFTSGKMVDDCVDELIKNSWDSVITVLSPSKRCEWIGIDQEGRFDYIVFPEQRKQLRTKKEVVPSGNVYAITREALFKNQSIISDKTGIVYVSHEVGIDIDYQADFDFAEFLILKKKIINKG